MSNLTTLLAFALPVAILAWMARRDHRAQLASRRPLLDACAGLFDPYAITHGSDGFPRLAGRCGTHNIDVRLISDTMTIRRLPQLWLEVTRLERVKGTAGFSVLVRPSGYEFYSLAPDFHHVIDTPSDFPSETMVRGRNANSRGLFEKLAPTVARILADPRIKEVAVTPAGLRIIRQAGEGRRGEYLLLRQATFDAAAVPPETLQSLIAGIEALYRAASQPHPERSPA